MDEPIQKIAKKANKPYRIGVLLPTSSIQMSAQYDALADLKDFEFFLLYRNKSTIRYGWIPGYPQKTNYEFLPKPNFPLPASIRFHLNTNVTKVLERHNFDATIIHGFYDNSAAWNTIAWCKKNKKPYLVRCDANIIKTRNDLRRIIRKFLISKNMTDAAAYLYIGTRNKEYYQFFNVNNKKLFLAPWEFDYDDLEVYRREALPERLNLRTQLGIQNNECVIITVSRLLRHKGYDTLIPVIGRLYKEGLSVKLVVAGEGPYRAGIEKLIERYSAPVTLCGNLDRQNVVKTLVASDIFVLVSYREPWGLVVNEAALCGLPLILSSAVGAAADLLYQGENGYIFESGKQHSLYQCLIKLIEAPVVRKKMGQKSRDILENWRRKYPAIVGYEQALNFALTI